MTARPSPDPIARLRAADPAARSHADSAPSTTDVHDVLEEILMTETTPVADTVDEVSPFPSIPPARRTPWIAAAAASVVLLVGLGAFLASNGDDATEAPGGEVAVADPPAADPIDPAAGGAAGQSDVTSCVESYDLSTLGNREYAFDATVDSVDGPDMSFMVNEWFTTGPFEATDATVTLDHQGLEGMLFAPEGPALEPGTRVLVAGDGGFVWSCGFTMLHDAALADQWRSALG